MNLNNKGTNMNPTETDDLDRLQHALMLLAYYRRRIHVAEDGSDYYEVRGVHKEAADDADAFIQEMKGVGIAPYTSHYENS